MEAAIISKANTNIIKKILVILKPFIENNVSVMIGRIIFRTKSKDRTEGKANTKEALILKLPNQWWLIKPILVLIPTIKGNKELLGLQIL